MALGAYSTTNSYGDILVMLAASAKGVACIRWNGPRIPLPVAVVLGGLAERHPFVSYSLIGWSWPTRLSVVLVVLALVLFAPALRKARDRRRQPFRQRGGGAMTSKDTRRIRPRLSLADVLSARGLLAPFVLAFLTARGWPSTPASPRRW